MGTQLDVLPETYIMGNTPASGLCAFAAATTQASSLFFELARHGHALSLKDVSLPFHLK